MNKQGDETCTLEEDEEIERERESRERSRRKQKVFTFILRAGGQVVCTVFFPFHLRETKKIFRCRESRRKYRVGLEEEAIVLSSCLLFLSPEKV